MMTHDFQAINIAGQVFNRNQSIQDLKASHISYFFIRNVKLTRTKDTLTITYVLKLESSDTPGIIFPTAQMSIFQKVDGKWKWHAQGDLNLFLGV